MGAKLTFADIAKALEGMPSPRPAVVRITVRKLPRNIPPGDDRLLLSRSGLGIEVRETTWMPKGTHMLTYSDGRSEIVRPDDPTTPEPDGER